MNNYILLIILLFYSCRLHSESKEETKDITDQHTRTLSLISSGMCADSSSLDKKKNIGFLKTSTGDKYSVYSSYVNIQKALTVGGYSSIILEGEKDSFYYRIESYEDLPYKARNDTLFFCKDHKASYFIFNDAINIICTPGGCDEGFSGGAPSLAD